MSDIFNYWDKLCRNTYHSRKGLKLLEASGMGRRKVLQDMKKKTHCMMNECGQFCTLTIADSSGRKWKSI